MSKKETKNKKIHNIKVRLDEDTMDKLVKICVENDETVSQIIRFLIKFYYDLCGTKK